jgi:hypothetical protein
MSGRFSRKGQPRKLALCACWLGFMAWCMPASADGSEQPVLRLGGLLFGDVYTIPSHHAPEGDGVAGAVLSLTFFLDLE